MVSSARFCLELTRSHARACRIVAVGGWLTWRELWVRGAGARIHAQNAIRQKNNAQNYLRLSSRVDAVSSRLESAIKMQQVTKSMGGVVKNMDKVLASMNVEQISKVMEKFEQSFEDMDVRSEYVQHAIAAGSALTPILPRRQTDVETHGAEGCRQPRLALTLPRYVEQTMNSSTTAVMPEEQVDELMQMVPEEHS